MTTTTLDFNAAHASEITSAAAAPIVRIRSRWADPWVVQPDVYAESATFADGNHVNTAQLRYYYGRTKAPADNAYVDRVRVNHRGQFVLIEFPTITTPLHWCGYIETPVDVQQSNPSANPPQAGEQILPCYGMDRALTAPLQQVFYRFNDGNNDVVRSGGSASVFNGQIDRPGVEFKNRSAAKIGGSYVFENDPAVAEYWTTRDIVEYLLLRHFPSAAIGFSLDSDNLPGGDRPIIDARQRTIADVLNMLVNPQRLMTWGVGYDLASNAVHFSFDSILESDLAIPGGRTFPANPNTFVVNHGSDPLTTAVVTEDSLDVYDRIIVRGAQRVTVCTLSNTLDSNFGKLWTDALETEYETAASNDAGYAAANDSEKRRMNRDKRQEPKFADVFSLIGYEPSDIPTHFQAQKPLFPSVDDPAVPATILNTDLRFLEDLPLAADVDYSGAGPWNHHDKTRRPIFAIGTDDLNNEFDLATLGSDSYTRGTTPIRWSATLAPVPGRLAFRIRVRGGPQHAIGIHDKPPFNEFDPLPVDDLQLGYFSYLRTQVTCAIQEPRYCETKYPLADPSPLPDVLRERVFYLGDRYQQIYVYPDTVVGLNPFVPLKSDGGYIRDDTDKLKEVATILGRYYTTPRRSLTLTTHRITNALAVGDLVRTVDSHSQPINAVVSRIEIKTPIAANGNPAGSPTQTITASSSRVNLVDILRRKK